MPATDPHAGSRPAVQRPAARPALARGAARDAGPAAGRAPEAAKDIESRATTLRSARAEGARRLGALAGRDPLRRLARGDRRTRRGSRIRRKRNRRVDEDAIAQGARAASGRPYLKIDPLRVDSELVAKTLSRPFARRHVVVAVGRDADGLVIAVTDPFDTTLRETLETLVHEPLRLVVCAEVATSSRSSIASTASARRCRRPSAKLGTTGRGSALVKLVELRSSEELAVTTNDEHVVAAVDYLLNYAFEQRASDIHLQPRATDAVIRFRIDGILHEIETHPALGARRGRLARQGAGGHEHRRAPAPAGRPHQDPARARARWSCASRAWRRAYGEKIVVRVFDPSVLMTDLRDLGFSADERERFERWITCPNGLILVTGPTGSGKTTTLYSTLRYLSGPEINITTRRRPDRDGRRALLPGAGEPADRRHLRERAAHDPAPGPRHHHGRRGARHRDRRDGGAGRADRPSRLHHAAHAQRGRRDHAPGRARRRALPALERAARRGRAAADPPDLPALRGRGHADARSRSPRSASSCPSERRERLVVRWGEGCVECRHTGLYGRSGVFEMLDVGRRVRALINQGTRRQRDPPRGAHRGHGEPARGRAAQARRGRDHLRRGRARHGGHRMSSTGDELRALVRAGWRLLALETFEEDRALGLLERVAQALERRCVAWSCASGLARRRIRRRHARGGPARDRAQSTEPALFALLDAHRGLDDRASRVRRLRDLLPALGDRKQCSCSSGPPSTCPTSWCARPAASSCRCPARAELRARAEARARAAQTRARTRSTSRAACAPRSGSPAPRRRAPSARRCAACGALDDTRGRRDRARQAPRAAPHARALLPRRPSRPRRGRRARRAEALARRAPPRLRRRGARVRPARCRAACCCSACRAAASRSAAKAVAREWRFPLLRLDLAAAFGGGAAPEAALREAIAGGGVARAGGALDRRDREGLRRRRDRDPAASRVFGSVPHLALREARAGVRRRDRQRRGRAAARAAAPRPLRRALLRRSADARRARARSSRSTSRARGRDPPHYDLERARARGERLTGAELEQVVGAALYTAFAESARARRRRSRATRSRRRCRSTTPTRSGSRSCATGRATARVPRRSTAGSPSSSPLTPGHCVRHALRHAGRPRDPPRARAEHLWASFARKFEPIAQATQLEPMPEFELARIGGLAAAKDEIQTYACAATDARDLRALGHASAERRCC